MSMEAADELCQQHVDDCVDVEVEPVEAVVPLPPPSSGQSPEDVLLSKPVQGEDMLASGSVAAVVDAAAHQNSTVKVDPLNELGEGNEHQRGLPFERYFGEAARQTCDREETLPLAKQAMQDSTSIHKVHSSAMLTAEENYYNEMALAG